MNSAEKLLLYDAIPNLGTREHLGYLDKSPWGDQVASR